MGTDGHHDFGKAPISASTLSLSNGLADPPTTNDSPDGNTNKTSVLLPSQSTRRYRPRRRLVPQGSHTDTGPTSEMRNAPDVKPNGVASSANSVIIGNSTSQSSLASGKASKASAAPSSLSPRVGKPLVGIRAKYRVGHQNGYPSPEEQARKIIALANAPVISGPKTLEEADAMAAAAAAAAAKVEVEVKVKVNGTPAAHAHEGDAVPLVLPFVRTQLPSFDGTSSSPPKPLHHRRHSLPSFHEPNGLWCPGRNELKGVVRRASDPGLPTLRELMRRRMYDIPNDPSSPTDVDREADHVSEGIVPQNANSTQNSAPHEDTDGAIMITPRRRRARLRRSPRIDPVPEVDESRETLPSWALDHDDFINGRELQDDSDTIEEEDEDAADSFSEINESAPQ